MASIVIEFTAGNNEQARMVAEKFRNYMHDTLIDESDHALEDRGGVVGPLVHPRDQSLVVVVWVHEAVATVFRQKMSYLFSSNEFCITVCKQVKGLPDVGNEK